MDSSDKMNRRSFLRYVIGAVVAAAGAGGAVAALYLRPKPREPMISYCGLNCVACPDGLFEVSCDGCLTTDGKHTEYWSETCQIRPCATDKGIANCAYCDDYGCQKLMTIHRMFPKAKATLDKIRRNL